MILSVEGDSNLSILATAVVSPCSDVGVKLISVEKPLGNLALLVKGDVVVRNCSTIVVDLRNSVCTNHQSSVIRHFEGYCSVTEFEVLAIKIFLAEEELEAAEVVSNDCLAILRHECGIEVILEYAAVRVDACYVRNVNVELSKIEASSIGSVWTPPVLVDVVRARLQTVGLSNLLDLGRKLNTNLEGAICVGVVNFFLDGLTTPIPDRIHRNNPADNIT